MLNQRESKALKTLSSLMKPAVPTNVFVTYWKFAFERQNIFMKRIKEEPFPWTQDPVLLEFRFTNPYRASDRISQFLLRNVQYNQDWSKENIFFRTLLFKFFNKIETWELLLEHIGEPRVENFEPTQYSEILTSAIDRGNRIFSAAYIMPSGGSKSGFKRKHEMLLNLLSRMIEERTCEKLSNASSMEDAFNVLRSYPTIGDFLAYQYVTDLNYSTILNFSEMDFVKAGPGSIEGVSKCFSDFGGKNIEWILRQTTLIQKEAFSSLNLNFADLWGRSLQLIDCQNLYCELAKYSRVMHPEVTNANGRKKIKQKFSPNSQGIQFFFPPKWNLDLSTTYRFQ